MNKNTNCSECGGTMQEGYILDVTRGGRIPSSWIEGKPEKDFWQGLNIEGKQVFYIAAYRCKDCGFLKFYADTEVTPDN